MESKLRTEKLFQIGWLHRNYRKVILPVFMGILLVILSLSLATPVMAAPSILTLDPSGNSPITPVPGLPGTGPPYDYQKVSDDSDSSYLFTNVPSSWLQMNYGIDYLQDLYEISDSGGATDEIIEVQVGMRVKRDSFTSGVLQKSARTVLYTNGSFFFGDPEEVTTDWVDYVTTYDKNPQTSLKWTWSEIDNLQAGVELRSATDGWVFTYCSEVWIEVQYGVNTGQITVIKEVVNDHGGQAKPSDFTIFLNDPSGTSFPGDESGTTIELDAGTAYNVTETGPAGYQATFVGDCTGTIEAGIVKLCIISNDDIPPPTPSVPSVTGWGIMVASIIILTVLTPLALGRQLSTK